MISVFHIKGRAKYGYIYIYLNQIYFRYILKAFGVQVDILIQTGLSSKNGKTEFKQMLASKAIRN